LKIISPEASRAKEGQYKFNIDLSQISHLARSTGLNGQIQEKRIEVQRHIDKILKDSRAIDRENLCIYQGKLVWQV
jgi:exosome complex RNA-binding protein Rrp42 (RNase PH superfamily)